MGDAFFFAAPSHIESVVGHRGVVHECFNKMASDIDTEIELLQKLVADVREAPSSPTSPMMATAQKLSQSQTGGELSTLRWLPYVNNHSSHGEELCPSPKK